MEPGRVTFLDAVSDLGALTVLDGFLTDAALAQRIAEIDPERELERAALLGLRFVVPGDEEWPTALDDLSGADPVQELRGVVRIVSNLSPCTKPPSPTGNCSPDQLEPLASPRATLEPPAVAKPLKEFPILWRCFSAL